jgi:hypothetical protein
MFISLTDPKTSIMFVSESTMVTAVIRFRDEVSCNMHGMAIIQWNLYIMDILVQDTFVHYSEVSFIGSMVLLKSMM